jgi:uncharacterized membrane protein
MVAIVAIILVPPFELLAKTDVVGYAVCHRIPERSFAIAGRQLPLCARCTGTFLGAILGLAVALVRRRHRASRLPSPIVLLLLFSFVAVWGLDGLNSYMTLIPGAPHVYEPRNWLRLTTGMLNGIALVTFVLPVWNFTLWRDVTNDRIIKNFGELLVLLPIAGLLIWMVLTEAGFLLYPLAILSSLGVVAMLTLVYSMIVAVVLRRDGYATSWGQLVTPLTIGLAVSLVQIAAMALFRDYLTASLGLPF